MIVLKVNFNFKRGNKGDVFVKYTEYMPIKRHVKISDIKLIYEKAMQKVLRKPTAEQKVYRERFYCIDQVGYLAKTSQGSGYYTCQFPPDVNEVIPPVYVCEWVYEMTFDVTYTLFKPPLKYYIRVENSCN